MKRMATIVGIVVLVNFGFYSGTCQTVFSVFQRQQKQADENFEAKLYLQAIPAYTALLEKKQGDEKNSIRLAQCFFFTGQYESAIAQYDAIAALSNRRLPTDDFYRYAEAQSVLRHYDVALAYYNECLKDDPENELVMKKIWRLKNIEYLYEDSTHCYVRPLNINTTASEICPVEFQNKLVFASTTKPKGLVENINMKTNAPFYQLYSSKKVTDTLQEAGIITFDALQLFAKPLKSRYNVGPVAFYQNERAMVYVATSAVSSRSGDRTLGLYFARLENDHWVKTEAYPFNSNAYSIKDVTINESGTKLFFSATMADGFGMADIYVSSFSNGKWTKPKNVGEPINTPGNEVFPFLHKSGTLYFSSDGHPGLGGMDLYKIELANAADEPQNLGFPMNSSYDDFGISFDSSEVHGYFSSNRIKGGVDDDIFEFDLDLQTYPFTITGIIKVKDHAWSDPTTIQVWPNKGVTLVDSKTGTILAETRTDAGGNFSISIPYFSQYFIQLVDESGTAYKASFNIQRQKAQATEHEIVIVKDIFKLNEE